ncbi:sortilin-related receptor-like [Ruditapes philippinarum]|uniref:sortilin-related receptor-like n=1 Tax=Ruditapes philippinarum TaxID=129788 RepID=UPI00295B8BA5|nr:sortilin-related receptor-like [Ruditapes philippinarum]
MKYIQYLLRHQLYNKKNTTLKDKVDKQEVFGAHIGLQRVFDKPKQRKIFTWINNYTVTFSAWESGQPSTGECTRTSFEYFNTDELWATEDCFSNIVDFFICEKPFPVDGENRKPRIKQDQCKSVYLNEDIIASPHSGKTCQNWGNLSGKAERDFDTNSYNRKYLTNSTLCQDPSNQNILWCYVNGTGESIREPCYLPHKGLTTMPEKRLPDVNCSDGSEISMINWCDGDFDCSDYSDELSCQSDIQQHNLTNIVNIMKKSHPPQRSKRGQHFMCEKSKEWISTLALCDNVIDCLDASDEVNCSHRKIGCDDNGFLCDGGNCIKLNQVCDFISDCTDGTDELCDYRKCEGNEFTCTNKQCIPAEKKCNAIIDCLDYSDEMNCDSCKKSFLCADESKCIPRRLTSDRYSDCKDSRDEKLCNGFIQSCVYFSGEYLPAGKVFTPYTIWNYQLEGNKSGKHTFSSQSNSLSDLGFSYPGVLTEDFSCVLKVQTDCTFNFREASLIDNFKTDFAYPFCECTIETFKYDFLRLDWHLLSVTRCDGSEITRLHVDEESIYPKITIIIDLNFESTSDLLHQTKLPPYCTYEYNVTEIGDFIFFCERDDKVIPRAMMCIYAIDASGYMTGCRSGDHLQSCENFSCPVNTVKCPGSYCIEQRFLCDGHIDCPRGEDEQDCSKCLRYILLFSFVMFV